jgi:predicted RNA-binding Zn-ribbon protein involved in translation (DUF1610 family)
MLSTYLETPAHSHMDMGDELFEMANDDDKKKFLCKFPNCGKYFRYKSEIVRHAATHSESRPFVCQYDNCYKAFKRNDALENHIRSSHTKETPFICPVADCGARFTTHGSFRYHVLKHNKQGHDFIDQPFEEEPANKQIKLNPSINNPFAYNGKAIKFEPNSQHLVEQAMTKEFFEPAPRFASGLKWEMHDDEEIENSNTENENIQTIKEKVPDLAEENKMLKERLANSDKVIADMQRQMSQMMNELVVLRSQVDFGAFGDFNDQSQTTPSDFTQKGESSAEMINYSESKNLPSPSAGLFVTENNSIDFLSFSQDMTSFDF